MSDSVLKFAKALLISAVAALVFAPAWFIYSYAGHIFPENRTPELHASPTPTPQAKEGVATTNLSPTPTLAVGADEPDEPKLPYEGLNLLIGIAAIGVAVLGFLATVFLGVVGLQIYIGAKERERSEKVLEEVESNGKEIAKAKEDTMKSLEAMKDASALAETKESELRDIISQAEVHLARMERLAKAASVRDRDMMITGIKVRAQARRILDVKPQLPVAAATGTPAKKE